jgi:hypothetical protein
MVKPEPIADPSVVVKESSAGCDAVDLDCGSAEVELVGAGVGTSVGPGVIPRFARVPVGIGVTPRFAGTLVGTSVTPAFTGTCADAPGVDEGVGSINVCTTVGLGVAEQAANRAREATKTILFVMPLHTLRKPKTSLKQPYRLVLFCDFVSPRPALEDAPQEDLVDAALWLAELEHFTNDASDLRRMP